MPSRRVVFVTRRFWPLVGPAERQLADIAESFSERGYEVTVLTVQWEPHWAGEIIYRNFRVARLPHPPVPGWGSVRYYWSLWRWLRQHALDCHAIFVSHLREEAFIALTALGSSRQPVIVVANGDDTESDAAWLARHRFGGRIRQQCASAYAIVTSEPRQFDELANAGFPRDRIQLIPYGLATVARSMTRRREARQSLADANGEFATSEQTPVGLYVGPIAEAAGLPDLLRAWRRIVELWPDARLWLVGEGPDRNRLFERARDLHLQYHVSLPGGFDDLTDVWAAADVFVLPGVATSSALPLLEALGARLPCVVADGEAWREFVSDQRAWLVPPKKPLDLAEAIARVLIMHEETEAKTTAAECYVRQQHALATTIEQYVQLIESFPRRSEAL